MPTLGDLKKAVCAFANRDEQAFNKNGFDCLLQACNNARKYAERTIDFEFSRVSVELADVDIEEGAELSSATLYPEGGEVLIKRVQRGFLVTSEDGNIPVNLYSRDKYVSRLKKRFENVARVEDARNEAPAVHTDLGIILHGTKVYPVPTSSESLGGSTVTLRFDAWKWLSDYEEDESVTDFLLTNCFDYLLYRTLWELQLFIKDAQVVEAVDAMWKNVYENVKQWNAQIVGGGVDDYNLD